MPIPIRPSNSSDSTFNNYFPVNMELLQNDLLMKSSLNKKALANDGDADILFNIWKNSSVINDEEEIEKKIYRIKENVNKNDLLKLKASGLIMGNDKEIHFTDRAANIIKTMVLGEPNSFGKQSIKKPYSIILAEQLSPKRKSALALASKMIDLKDYDIVKTSQTFPGYKDRFLHNERVISKGVASPTSNKEYNVRIYKNPAGNYDLWTFWGRTNGSMRSEKINTFDNLESAKYRAREIINSKKYGDNKYKAAEDIGMSPVNISIPGIPNNDSATTLSTPSKKQKSQPEVVVPPEKEVNYEALSEEEKEKILGKWFDEIRGGNTKHLKDFLKDVVTTNPPKKILERMVNERYDPSGRSNFPPSIRQIWIEKVLNQPNVNPEFLEIISNVRKNMRGDDDGWINKIEQKLLEKATGKEDWALDILKRNPPKSWNDIKPELQERYFNYLSKKQVTKVEETVEEEKEEAQWRDEQIKNRKKLLGEDEEDVTVAKNVTFNLKKYSAVAGDMKDDSKKLSTQDLQAIENRIQQSGLTGEVDDTDMQILLDSEYQISPKTLEIIFKLITDSKNYLAAHTERKKILDEMSESFDEIEQKLLKRATDEDWALDILKRNPPKSWNDIKPALQERYFNYLSKKQAPKIEEDVEEDNTEQWRDEQIKNRKKLLGEEDDV